MGPVCRFDAIFVDLLRRTIPAMIEVKNLSKTFRLKSGNVDALNDVSLSIADGTVYGVIGYSGAGKSTLVRCLNLLEIPDQGNITVGEYRDIQVKNGGTRNGTT